MEKNVGKIDRIIRTILAFIFVILGVLYSPWFFVVVLILMYTIFTASCLPYRWFGINTNKGGKK